MRLLQNPLPASVERRGHIRLDQALRRLLYNLALALGVNSSLWPLSNDFRRHELLGFLFQFQVDLPISQECKDSFPDS